jgi:two-component system, LuxR family, response regulator FixJ
MQLGEIADSRSVVIVVDDDLAVRNSLRFSLELEGFAVRDFGTGHDLLKCSDSLTCACLVVDQNMPGINGIDLIADLRSRAVSAPAILMTTHPSADLRTRAARRGIPIVEKPLLGNTLLDKIRDACTQNYNRV